MSINERKQNEEQLIIEKKSNKKVIYILSAFLCIIVLIVFLIFINNPVNRAIKYYKEDSLESYEDIKDKMNESDFIELGSYLQDEVTAIYNAYLEESCSYKETVDKMGNILFYCDKKYIENYTGIINDINRLEDSRNAFISAIEFELNGVYEKAYDNYLKVIVEDKNYEVAQDKLDSIILFVVEELTDKAEVDVINNDFASAITCVEKAIKYLNENDEKKLELQQIRDMYIIQKEEYDKKIAEEERQKKLLTSGKVLSSSDFTANYKSAVFSKSIKPDNTSGAYIYYKSDDDKIYLDIRFTIKNISNFEKELETLVSNLKVTYDDKYTYTRYSLFYSQGDDIDSVYSWDTLEPLEEATFHIAIEMPEEIALSDSSLYVEFTFLGQQQILEYR